MQSGQTGHQRTQMEKAQEEEIVRGKYPEEATDVETLEIVFFAHSRQEDVGYQKSGEGEEHRDADRKSKYLRKYYRRRGNDAEVTNQNR